MMKKCLTYVIGLLKLKKVDESIYILTKLKEQINKDTKGINMKPIELSNREISILRFLTSIWTPDTKEDSDVRKELLEKLKEQ